jgi:hypothetical protein
VAKEVFKGERAEGETTGKPDSGWLSDSSYRMVCSAHGKPAGYIVFARSSAVSNYERNNLATIFNTIASIMGSAIENINHRTEAAMLEKLKMRRDSI